MHLKFTQKQAPLPYPLFTLISVLITALVILNALQRPRSRIHWVGYPARRPMRLERLLIITLIPIAMLVLKEHQYLLWSVIWGGAFSAFVIVKSVQIFAFQNTQGRNVE